jgi:DNA-binding response OmpR family regulator
MPSQLVVLIGDAARTLRHARDLLTANPNMVVVLAANLDAVRDWLTDPEMARDALTASQEVVRLNDLVIDRAGHRAEWKGKLIHLTEHELGLIGVLAEHPGRALTFAELVACAWGTPYYGHPSPVHAAMRRLRSKLKKAGVEVRLEAVRGVGFRLTV